MKTFGAIILATLAMAVPHAARAQMLDMPAAALRVAEQVMPLASYGLPVAAWDGATLRTVPAEGEVTRQAWQIRAEGQTTLQILAPLRAQLQQRGFEIVFECQADACGGFDFRYATEVLPEPKMHVDLGDFRFLSARRAADDDPESVEYISLLVSRSSTRGYVQVVRVGAPRTDAGILVASTKNPDTGPGTTRAPVPAGDVAQNLDARGRAVLADLDFRTGSAALGDGPFATLDALAGYLRAHPERSVMLVGHTDAEGALEGNIALSRRRAQSVVDRLTGDLGIPAARVQAQGVGYLAPLASNDTEDGRSANRRVEAVLTTIPGE